jgi:penicillin amidase/acyl-homoserine-lactone acylase
LDPEWGAVQKHGRDERMWPVSGGPDTLRAMYAERIEENDPHFTVTAGDGLYYLIEWKTDGTQQVLGTHQYGSHMTDSTSPHYLDQAEAFSDEIPHRAHFPSLPQAEITKRYEVSHAAPLD